MKIYPVIHITEGLDLAVSQAELAKDKGADGVFLIDHEEAENPRTFDAFSAIFKLDAVPADWFVGINLLRSSPLSAFEESVRLYDRVIIPKLPSGIWTDDASRQRREVQDLRTQKPQLFNFIDYLGGVSFKYVDATEDPAVAAMQARYMSPFVDVVTTSGKATGQAPTRAKIDAMKDAIGDQSLAIASGVNTENLRDFISADQVLISTSIETRPGSGEFDPDKLSQIIHMAHEL